MAESVQSRYSREWLEIRDDRDYRGLYNQHVERKDRLFVDPVTHESAVTGNTPPQFDE